MKSVRDSLPGALKASWRWLRGHPARWLFIDTLAALVVFFAAYRVLLWTELLSTELTPFFTIPERHSWRNYAGCSLRDIFVAALLAAPLALLAARAGRAGGEVVRGAARLAIAAVLTVIAGLSLTHLRLGFILNTGLTWSLLAESFETSGTGDALAYAETVDLVLMWLPGVLVLGLAWLSDGGRKLVGRGLLGALAVVLVLQLSASTERKLPPELRRNPVHWLAELGLNRLTRGPSVLAGLTPAVSADQQQSLRLVDPRFVPPGGASSPQAAPVPRSGPAPENLLVVVMEGAGASYVFDDSVGEMPMPRLRDLADNGWYLANHYTTANTSPRAIFSIFSGLYPAQHHRQYSSAAEIVIPSLFSFLLRQRDYDRFLVTPGLLRWYFPRAFLTHSGLTEMHGYENLELTGERYHPRQRSRDELRVVDFFLDRLERARRPFAAVYYSFVPHYDYPDYGPEFRILPDTDDQLQRYYNNLRMLDTLIGRMVDALAASGELERTLVVVVSDHGEAFGQHPGNYVHSRAAYEENLRAPVVFYHPATFAPRRVDTLTSHVDILPTVLDALDAPYEPALLQGASLLRGTPRRRYVFVAGNEGSNTAVSSDGTKLQIAMGKDACWVFDLRADPGEKQRLGCERHIEQRDALLAFRRLQPDLLMSYNAALLEADSPERALFHGRAHPPGRRAVSHAEAAP